MEQVSFNPLATQQRNHPGTAGRPGALATMHVAVPANLTTQVLRTLTAVVAIGGLIVADEPWPDYQTAQALAGLLAGSQNRLRFFACLLCRGAVQAVLSRGCPGLLAGPITQIEIRLWTAAIYSSTAPGQIGGVGTLSLHALSVIRRLLPDARFQTTAALAARHFDSIDPAQPTCHATKIEASNGQGGIPIVVSAATHVLPSLAVKQIVIAGSDRQIHVDIDHDTADLVTMAGAERIYPDGQASIATGYEVLATKLAAGDATVGLGLDEALSVQKILDDARAYFPAELPVLSAENYPPQPGWLR